MKINFNGQVIETDNQVTIARLLEQLDLASRPVAVEVNQQVVPRAEHATYVLHEYDQVEVVTLVGGG